MVPACSLQFLHLDSSWLSPAPWKKSSGEVCCDTWPPHSFVSPPLATSTCYGCQGCCPPSTLGCPHGVIVLPCPLKLKMVLGPGLAGDLCTEAGRASSRRRRSEQLGLSSLHAPPGRRGARQLGCLTKDSVEQGPCHLEMDVQH